MPSGPSIFVDDAPEGDYSFKVLTGARRPHGWYILDTPADTATREDLARRMAYAGGDTSGWDITQLVRPPDTINTKQAYGGRYPVGIGLGTNQRYTVDALAAQFPPVATTQDAGAIDIDDQELAHWLGNVDACLRRIRAGTPTYQTLQGDGGPDRSVARWATACNLRKLYGLPSVEIAAILLTFCDWGHSTEKGSTWLYDDVRRCIADAEETYPQATINPTRGTQARPAVTLPEVARPSRARQDRPQRVTDDQYLAWCHTTMDPGQQVSMTRKEAAAALDISLPTLDRIERRQRERGAIERFEDKYTHRSWIAVYAARPMMIVPTQESAADAAERAPETAHEVLSAPRRIKDARTRKEEHTAPSVSPDAQPQPAAFPAALGAAVGEAFDAYSGARRLSWRKIAEYIAANYPGAPWDDRAIRWWCDRIRKERNRAAWIASLPSMTQKQLTKLDRWCERLLEEGPDGPRGRQYYAAKWQAPHVAQELTSERRRAALERVKIRPGRRPAPVQPWTELDATPLQKLTQVDACLLYTSPSPRDS